jgi:uncharacterized membrane protein YfcA
VCAVTVILIAFAAGAAAGLLGGLLGIGGGIVVMPVLRFGFGLSPALSAGTCVVAVFCTSLSGGLRHLRMGHVRWRTVRPVMLAGGAASAVFSLLFVPLVRQGRGLDLCVGGVFLLVALRMMAEGFFPHFVRPSASSVPRGRRPAAHVAIGLVSGLLPGLFGIGTGAVLVPAFVWLLGLPIKTAIGSSLVCFSVNAFISAVFKAAQGFVVFEYALPLCAGAVCGALLGARINRGMPPPALKVVFGGVFFAVALKYFFSI